MSYNSHFASGALELSAFLYRNGIATDSVELILRFPTEAEAHRMDLLLQSELSDSEVFRGVYKFGNRTVSNPDRVVRISGMRIKFEWGS